MYPKDDVEREEMSKIPYRSLIGSLMYLATSTRPDIAYAVSALGQYNSDYGLEHWKAAKRVLRYLQGTKHFKLVFKKTNKPLVGFADADWGADVDHRRSYTGYVFQMANTAISWMSRKQKSVAMSSTEAEYVALSEAAKEAVHLRAFLSGIIGKQPATTIYNNNQGAGNMARNPVLHGRAKHIDIR
ncbi:retrovirus-related pol polyprotein from transposon tnt 1-94, partial [Lasius niger]